MIVIATQCFAPDAGGIENLMTGLTKALYERGHALTVCADRRRGDMEEPGFPWPVKRFSGPRPWRRRAKAREIARLIEQGKATHIVCDSWKSLEALSAPPGMPVLCLAHGMEIPQRPTAGKRRRIRNSLAKATCVIANSRFTAALVSPFLGQDVALEIIPPGVDAPGEPGESINVETEKQLTGFSPRLISVGRLEEHKGQDQVLRCLPDLMREFPQLGYICLGEGPARAQLEGLARELGVSDRLLLSGTADEPTRTSFLDRCDVFVLPGRRVDDRVEGFGMAFIEAAWRGLPAVAGETGGGCEAVEHGMTGLVCRGEDTDAVCAAIRELLTDAEKRRQLGGNAKERARAFAWDKTVRCYEELFKL